MHKLSHSSNDRRALKRRLDAVRKFVKPLLEVDIPGISEQPQIPVYRDVILVSNPHDLKADLVDTIINSSDPSERMSALAYLITIVKFFKIERTVMDDLHLNNEHFSEISNLLDNACKTILRNIIDGIKDLNKELWFNLLAWPFRLGSAVFTVGAI
ncbi:hypothetical protein KKF81_00830 [Candidatus Micrarchaeota archaeon]|nr:hypothetical protein [Candidatus Micrarchaeota archaeon]MBU1165464.1 hypothetical protein [Candidatus Micrarchaeota archaeon]MBU1887445.1 hypothetical protein [Candidatus Micrarchaeota archaeon]